MAEEPTENELNNAPSDCERCRKAYEALVVSITEANITWIHVNRSVLTDRARKLDKATFLNYFKAKVCALRNSNGGVLMVHLEGQEEEDRCLEKFDEAVEQPLKSLITDGSIFTDNYKRQWLPACGVLLKDYHDCIELTVRKSKTVCTTNYNTKVTSDLAIEPPTLDNLNYILQQPVPSSLPIIRGLDDLNESRHLQSKEYHEEVDEDINVVCKTIWKRYRLREYLTAMSNVEDGGSVLIGVKEDSTGLSKKYYLKGFKLSNDGETKLKSALTKSLETIVQLTRESRTFKTTSQDSFDIRFYRLPDSQDKVVLEISVRKTDGVLFFNNGPTAYEIVTEENKKKIKKMSKSRWIERLFET